MRQIIGVGLLGIGIGVLLVLFFIWQADHHESRITRAIEENPLLLTIISLIMAVFCIALVLYAPFTYHAITVMGFLFSTLSGCI